MPVQLRLLLAPLPADQAIGRVILHGHDTAAEVTALPHQAVASSSLMEAKGCARSIQNMYSTNKCLIDMSAVRRLARKCWRNNFERLLSGDPSRIGYFRLGSFA